MKKINTKFALSILTNALVMLALSIFLLNQPIVHDDEGAMIKQTAEYKLKVMGRDKMPSPNDFLFINIAYDKELIEYPNDLSGFGLDLTEFCNGNNTLKKKSTPTDSEEKSNNDDEFGNLMGDLFGDEATTEKEVKTEKPANKEEDFDDVMGDLFGDEESTLNESETEQAEKFSIEYPLGTEVITNRGLLAMFFSILNKEQNYKYIICDVLFDLESPNDKFLKQEFEKLENVIVPSWFEDDEFIEPIFDVNSGLATYTAVDDKFVKYNLIEDSLKTLPLKMYEDLHSAEFVDNGLFYKMNDKSVFRNFVLNLRIQNEDILSKDGIYRDSYWKFLSQSLCMNHPDSILKMTKDKIIVIADFENEKNDYHESAFGEIAGALIMVNAYLALVYGDNVISLWLFVILFVGFLIVSYFVFNPQNLFEVWSEKVKGKIEKSQLEGKLPDSWFLRILVKTKLIDKLKSSTVEFVTGFFSYMVLLIIISSVAFFALNNHISILYLSVYVFVLDKLVQKIRERKAAKE